MKDSNQPPKGESYSDTFGVKENQNPILTVITIAHVNQNHFIFIDD